MSDTPEARYRAILGRQLSMNKETWRRLTEHGVTPETELRLEFMYRAPDRGAAESLKEVLTDQTDYDVRVEASGSPLRRQWTVAGATQPTAVSLEILDQWVDWMVTAGIEHGCEFDGWGADV